MAYLLDSDVLISAKNAHYGSDFCPGFWDWLAASNAAGNVFSVQKVGEEVGGTGDDLSLWARARGPAFFVPPEATVQASFGSLSAWAAGQRYEQSAVSTFLAAADYYLIAQAHAGRHVVVTHERPAPDSKWKIKIPDACAGLQVACVSPFEMLRRLGARFVLAQ